MRTYNNDISILQNYSVFEICHRNFLIEGCEEDTFDHNWHFGRIHLKSGVCAGRVGWHMGWGGTWVSGKFPRNPGKVEGKKILWHDNWNVWHGLNEINEIVSELQITELGWLKITESNHYWSVKTLNLKTLGCLDPFPPYQVAKQIWYSRMHIIFIPEYLKGVLLSCSDRFIAFWISRKW